MFSALSALESISTFCGLVRRHSYPILESISTSVLLLSCSICVCVRLQCHYDPENAKCAIARIDRRLRWSEWSLSGIRHNELIIVLCNLATQVPLHRRFLFQAHRLRLFFQVILAIKASVWTRSRLTVLPYGVEMMSRRARGPERVRPRYSSPY